MVNRSIIILFIVIASVLSFGQEADTSSNASQSSPAIQTPANPQNNNKKTQPLAVQPSTKSNWSKIKDLFL